MSAVATAVVASAVIGGAVASNSAKKGAAAQKEAARLAGNIEMEQYHQNREDMQPWRDAGEQALYQLQTGLGQAPIRGAETPPEALADIRARLVPQYTGNYGGNGVDDASLDMAAQAEYDAQVRRQGLQQSSAGGVSGDLNRDFTLADFTKDPGYDFRMQQGQQALDRSAAARGGALGGGALKAAARYGQDYASGEYQNAYNRFNNDRTQRYNRLASLAGIGQTATRDVGAQGSQVASNIAGGMIGVGNSQAARGIAQGNAATGVASSLGNWAMFNSMQTPKTQWYDNGSTSTTRGVTSNSVPLSDGTTFQT